MAVKQFKPAKTRFRIKYKKTYLTVLIAFIAVSVICIGLKMNNDAKIAEYEKQISEVEQKLEKLGEENDEYTAVLSSTDRKDYYEKIAREVYGYAKPGEYVFYKIAS